MLFNNHKRKKKINKNVGKIGYCDGSTLGLPIGHYVYIRSIKNGKADVNTFTSLETYSHKYKKDKLNYVKNGNIYPIPITDTNLKLFSGVDNRIIKNVDVSLIKNKNSYYIKSRHKHYINRYVK